MKTAIIENTGIGKDIFLEIVSRDKPISLALIVPDELTFTNLYFAHNT